MRHLRTAPLARLRAAVFWALFTPLALAVLAAAAYGVWLVKWNTPESLNRFIHARLEGVTRVVAQGRYGWSVVETDPGAITELTEELRVGDVPGFVTLCGERVVFRFYARESLRLELGYVCAGLLRWHRTDPHDLHRAAGDIETTLESAEYLWSWLGQRGFEEGEYWRRQLVLSRSLRACAVLPGPVAESCAEVEEVGFPPEREARLAEIRTRVDRTLGELRPDPVERALLAFRLLGVGDHSLWPCANEGAQDLVARWILGGVDEPEPGLALLRALDDPEARRGAARALVAYIDPALLDGSILEAALEPLARIGLTDPRPYNRRLTYETLVRIAHARPAARPIVVALAGEVLRGEHSVPPPLPRYRALLERCAPGDDEPAPGADAADAIAAAYLLARDGGQAAVAPILERAQREQGAVRCRLEQAAKLAAAGECHAGVCGKLVRVERECGGTR